MALQGGQRRTATVGSTTKVRAKRMLKYWKTSQWEGLEDCLRLQVRDIETLFTSDHAYTSGLCSGIMHGS